MTPLVAVSRGMGLLSRRVAHFPQGVRANGRTATLAQREAQRRAQRERTAGWPGGDGFSRGGE